MFSKLFWLSSWTYTMTTFPYLPYHWPGVKWLSSAQGNGEKWCVPVRPRHKTPAGSTPLAPLLEWQVWGCPWETSAFLPHWNVMKADKVLLSELSKTLGLLQQFICPNTALLLPVGRQKFKCFQKYKLHSTAAIVYWTKSSRWHMIPPWPGPMLFTFQKSYCLS